MLVVVAVWWGMFDVSELAQGKYTPLQWTPHQQQQCRSIENPTLKIYFNISFNQWNSPKKLYHFGSVRAHKEQDINRTQLSPEDVFQDIHRTVASPSLPVILLYWIERVKLHGMQQTKHWAAELKSLPIYTTGNRDPCSHRLRSISLGSKHGEENKNNISIEILGSHKGSCPQEWKGRPIHYGEVFNLDVFCFYTFNLQSKMYLN